MAVLREWVAPILSALVLDLLLTHHPLYVHVLMIGNSFVAFLEAFQWLFAGYIDILYLTNNHRYSFGRLSVILSIPTARRVLVLSWHIARLISRRMWDCIAMISTFCLCFAALWQFFSPTWRKRIQDLWEFAQLWAILGPTTLIYGATVVISIILRSTAMVKRTLANIMSSHTPIFSYSSAPVFDPNTQIRILKLDRKLPFSEPSGELISCLPYTAPPYHAISYAWTQGAQDDRTMKLNGMNIYINGNVYNSLMRCSSFYKPQFIWIDSICIDQTSLGEKTVQVRKMQEIYSRAAHVLVCLGNGPAYLASNLIHELKGVRQLFGEVYLTQHVTQFIYRQRTDLYLRARVKALHELLQHSWFRRVWVVQEVVVAQRVTICYGRQSMPWSDFYKELNILSAPLVALLALQSSDSESLSPAWSYLGILSMPLIVAYRIEYHRFGPQSISHLLRVFGHREATVPMDKVFALVGMTKPYSADLKQLVDYKQKAEDDVLLDLGNFLLDNGEVLDVLDFAGVGWNNHNPNLASWVVDWTIERSGMPLTSTFAPVELQYHATRQNASRMARGESRQEMVVRGQYIDRICAILPIGSSDGSAQSADAVMAVMVSYLDKALDLAKTQTRCDAESPYTGLEAQPLEEAVWRTLIGDKTHSERPAPALYGKILRSQAQLLHDLGQVSHSYAPKMITTDHVRETLQAR
jgi:hypothetical protein